MAKTLLSQSITDLQGPGQVPSGPSTPDESPNAAPLLLQYWGAALRRKWLILAIMLLALAVGVAVTLLATPQYEAIAQIEISRDERNPTKIEGIEGDTAMQDAEFYETQYSLLKSRSLAERVARQLNCWS